jgi:hypothetical protein
MTDLEWEVSCKGKYGFKELFLGKFSILNEDDNLMRFQTIEQRWKRLSK